MTAILLLGLAAAQDDELLKSLQGVWQGARFTEGNGKDGAKGEGLVLVVKDKTLVVTKTNGSPVGQATLVLGGGYRNKTYLGILKIDGDELTWTINGTAGKDKTRPTGWTANAGNAVYLIVAGRKK
jgi:hypothetical protein